MSKVINTGDHVTYTGMCSDCMPFSGKVEELIEDSGLLCARIRLDEPVTHAIVAVDDIILYNDETEQTNKTESEKDDS